MVVGFPGEALGTTVHGVIGHCGPSHFARFDQSSGSFDDHKIEDTIHKLFDTECGCLNPALVAELPTGCIRLCRKMKSIETFGFGRLRIHRDGSPCNGCGS